MTINHLIKIFNAITVDPDLRKAGITKRIFIASDLQEFKCILADNSHKLKSEISDFSYHRIMREIARLENLNHQTLPYSDLLRILRECKKNKINIQRKEENLLFAI